MEAKKISNISFSSAASSICASDGGYGLSLMTSPGDASLTSADGLRAPKKQLAAPLKSAALPIPHRAVGLLPQPRSSAAMAAVPMVLRVRLNKYQTVLATPSSLICPKDLTEGCHVVLSGDRGEDLGLIESIVKQDDHHEGNTKLVSALRFPTQQELARYHQQRNEDEPRALRALRSIAKDVHFEGVVEDALYQWDGKKLTIFISRAHPRQFLDFRKIQRASFQQFQCRIWILYVDELE